MTDINTYVYSTIAFIIPQRVSAADNAVVSTHWIDRTAAAKSFQRLPLQPALGCRRASKEAQVRSYRRIYVSIFAKRELTFIFCASRAFIIENLPAFKKACSEA
jgi:hypothetical protein